MGASHETTETYLGRAGHPNHTRGVPALSTAGGLVVPADSRESQCRTATGKDTRTRARAGNLSLALNGKFQSKATLA